MTKSILKVLFAFCLLLALISSCNKDDDAPSGPAKYMVVYASPGGPAADLLVDNQKVNSAPLNYPVNTSYLDVLSGGRNFKLNQTGTNTLIAEAQYVVPPNINFSVYFYGAPTSIKSFAVLDDLSSPPGGKARLRFFHLCPAGPSSVDVGRLEGTNFTNLFPDRNFETNFSVDTTRKFIDVDAGVYDFDVRVGAGSISVLTRTGVNLEVGKIYTMYLRGIFNSPATPEALDFIQNN
jgi:hypothetical protein